MELKRNYEVLYREYRRAHLYSVNGEEYPSVTKILGIIGGDKTGALIGWAKKTSVQMMGKALTEKIGQSIPIDQAFIDWLSVEAKKEPQKIMEAAGDIGSRVHQAIDNHISGQPVILAEDAKIAFTSFLDWFKKNNLKFISGDLSVASVKYKFGGRLDALAEEAWGGKRIVLMDWKTSNALRDEYPLQVALYALALEETYSIRPSRAYIVRFGKDSPEIEEREVNLKEATKAALRTLKLYYSFANKGGFWK